MQKDPYFFGEFELDVERGLLIRSNGESTALRRQSLQVLRLLLDQAPSLVSKETLLDSVWGRQAVSESVVAQVIKELRQLLGDSAAQPGYIETRQRQGYRMLVPVLRQRPVTVTERKVIATPMVAAENVRVQHSAARRLKPLYVIIGSSFALTLLIAMLLLGGSGTRKPPASQLAHLRLDFRHAPSNLAGTTLSELRFVADAMLARGDIGPLQAHASTQRLQAPDAFSRGIIDVIELRSAGRDFDALARVEALLGVAPDDLPLRLLHQELALNWRSKSRVAAFVEPQLPPERQALLDARYAGLFGDAEGQAKAAQTAMAMAGESLPLRELARTELGIARQRMGDTEGAEAAFLESERQLRAAGFHRLALQPLWERASMARRTGKAPQLASELAELDDDLTLSGDFAMRAELTRQRGILHGVMGQHETSLGLLETAADMFLKLDDRQRASSALNASAGPMSRLGQMDRVLERLAEAQRLAVLSGHPESLAAILGNSSLFHWRRGEVSAAIDRMREALAQFEAADRRDDVAQARHNLATMLRQAGEPVAALAMRELSIAHARQAKLNADLATRLFALAEDLRARGEPAAAISALDESEQLYLTLGDTVSLESISCLRGLWWLAAGALKQARSALPAKLAESRATADQSACIALGTELSEPVEALAGLDAHLARQRAAGQTQLAQQTQLLRAEVLILAKRGQAAGEQLDQLRSALAIAGNRALQRKLAILDLALALSHNNQEAATLAASEAKKLIDRYPDQPAALEYQCRMTRTAAPKLRSLAIEQCLKEAQRLDMLAAARRWSSGAG